RVVGEVAAGGFPDREVGPGEAMRIMTGAPMPDGADTVVRVEDTDNASDVVTIGAATPKGMSIRQAGEDLRKGERVLEAGTVLRAAEIGLLASVGRARVRVRKRPRVAVFSTGDEIVDLDAPLERGQIRDSNRYTLASAVRAAGAEAWVRGIVPDSPDALRTALREGLAADAIVTSGGVSVGDHDHLKPVLAELGTIDFWAIAIRPGRPLAFGELTDGDRRVPIFGLPGNTVSALVTFEIFVRPALLRMQGRVNVARPRAKARLGEPVDKLGSLRFSARGPRRSLSCATVRRRKATYSRPRASRGSWPRSARATSFHSPTRCRSRTPRSTSPSVRTRSRSRRRSRRARGPAWRWKRSPRSRSPGSRSTTCSSPSSAERP